MTSQTITPTAAKKDCAARLTAAGIPFTRLIARTERPNAYCPRPTVTVTFIAPEFKTSMWDALIANMPAEKGYTAQLGWEVETAAEARRQNRIAKLIRDQWKPKNWAKLDALTQENN